MMTKFVAVFVLLALVAIAGTIPGAIATGHVTLTTPTVVKGATLKPGVYRVVVTADKATFTLGKSSQDISAKVETSTTKFDENKVQYERVGEQTTISQICLGGTKVRLSFN